MSTNPTLIQTILPGELLEGYRGRLARVNNASSRTAVSKLLWKHSKAAGKFEPIALAFHLAAAIINDISPVELCLEHTLLPIAWAVDESGLFENLDLRIRDVETCLPIYRTLRKQLWLCPGCVAKDNELLGFSYWRRDHQIPGIYVCSEHDQALRFIDLSNLIESFPSEVLEESQCGQDSVLLSAVAPPVLRAIEIIRRVASDAWYFKPSEIPSNLRLQARNRGIDTNSPTGLETISKLVNLDVPEWWLEDALFGVKQLGRDRLLFVKVALGRHAASTTIASIAVVAAVLFESADEALSALGHRRFESADCRGTSA